MDPWKRFEATARDSPAAAAVSAADGTITFAELRDRAERMAVDLAAAGVGPGRLVVNAQSNSGALLVTHLALWKIGAVPGLLSPRSGPEEWASILEGLPATDFLAAPDTVARWPGRRPAGGGAGPGLPAWMPVPEPSPGRPLLFGRGRAGTGPVGGLALVKFTSGSTGRPKAIGFTAGQLEAEARHLVEAFGLSGSSTVLAPVPLTHSYGFDLAVLPMIQAGVNVALEETFIPRRVLERLSAAPPALFLGVPAMYQLMVESAPTSPGALDRVGHLLSCTAPLNPCLIERFHAVFGAVICQHYGASETGAAANHVASEVLRRPASVGRALRGVTLRVAGETGGAMPAGVEGEIIVESDAVGTGYLLGGRPDRPAFEGRRFHTGDVGRLDAGGFLEILGRLDDMINVGGLKVSPLEVVRGLESHPAVREAVAWGAPDRVAGEVVEAMVVLRAAAGEDELIRHLAALLAEHKVPRRIRIADELPRGATGKVRPPRDEAPS